MYQATTRGKLLEIFLFAFSSLLIYSLGLGVLLFLIPLQIVSERRGERGLFQAAGLTGVMFLGVALYRYFTSGREMTSAVQSGIELFVVLLLILGLVAVNTSSLARFGGLYRLLGATLGAGLLAIPLLVLIPRVPGFAAAMRLSFTDASNALQKILSPADIGAAGPFAAQLFDPDTLMKLFVAYFLRSFLFIYFLLLTAAWRWGTAIAVRTTPAGASRAVPHRLAGFRLESFFLWPLIACGALILLDLVVGIPAVSYVAWNIGFIILFLFGLQGMAIFKFLFEKYRLPRILWVALVALIVFLLVSPSFNLFFAIAIPAFGVSENWIRYRIPRDPEADESGKE
jgi:hypothetical protein